MSGPTTRTGVPVSGNRSRPTPVCPAMDHLRLASRVAAITFASLILGACSNGALTPPPAIDTPAPPTDGADGAPPTGGLTVPKPGQLDVRPIPAEILSAHVDGRRVVLTIGWTSGVEPCSVLDSIVVERGDGSFAITLREGHGPGEVACIAIAMMKTAEVDLGELEPGTYTISDATGGAAPIDVVVS